MAIEKKVVDLAVAPTSEFIVMCRRSIATANTLLCDVGEGRVIKEDAALASIGRRLFDEVRQIEQREITSQIKVKSFRS